MKIVESYRRRLFGGEVALRKDCPAGLDDALLAFLKRLAPLGLRRHCDSFDNELKRKLYLYTHRHQELRLGACPEFAFDIIELVRLKHTENKNVLQLELMTSAT